MKIDVSYTLKADVGNYIRYVLRGPRFSYGQTNPRERLLQNKPVEARALFDGELDEDYIRSKLNVILETDLKSRPEFFESKVRKLTERWRGAGRQVVYRLEDIYRRPFPFVSEMLMVNLLAVT